MVSLISEFLDSDKPIRYAPRYEPIMVNKFYTLGRMAWSAVLDDIFKFNHIYSERDSFMIELPEDHSFGPSRYKLRINYTSLFAGKRFIEILLKLNSHGDQVFTIHDAKQNPEESDTFIFPQYHLNSPQVIPCFKEWLNIQRGRWSPETRCDMYLQRTRKYTLADAVLPALMQRQSATTPQMHQVFSKRELYDKIEAIVNENK